MKNQAVLFILFLTLLLCNAEITQNPPPRPFVSPIPQTSLTPSQTAVASTLSAKRRTAKIGKKHLPSAITDIFPPSGFDMRTESHGMYTKHFLTAGQTRVLLSVSFATVNSGVLLLKIEELLATVSGAARVVFRPRPRMSIPYWDILRARSQP